jgi:hypothetical protein
MPLNGYPITGEGETCSMEMAAQDPGTPLPSRPARAKAHDAAAWKPPPVVASNSDAGAVNMKGPNIGH